MRFHLTRRSGVEAASSPPPQTRRDNELHLAVSVALQGTGGGRWGGICADFSDHNLPDALSSHIGSSACKKNKNFFKRMLSGHSQLSRNPISVHLLNIEVTNYYFFFNMLFTGHN